MGERVGYTRVSSVGQNDVRQLEGLNLGRVFTDEASGKDTNRPKLNDLLDYVRNGDTVVVHSMDRLARNLDDLRRIVNDLTTRGVTVEFVKESLSFTGDDTAMSTLLLSVMGAFAEFERSLIHERQAEGIAIAKQDGRYKGRQQALTDTQRAEVRDQVYAGESKTAIAKKYRVSRNTIYKCLENVHEAKN